MLLVVLHGHGIGLVEKLNTRTIQEITVCALENIKDSYKIYSNRLYISVQAKLQHLPSTAWPTTYLPH